VISDNLAKQQGSQEFTVVFALTDFLQRARRNSHGCVTLRLSVPRVETATRCLGLAGGVADLVFLLSSTDANSQYGVTGARRGGITKTGNVHLRRIVGEAAWSYRRPPCIWYGLRRRQESISEEAKEIAWKAQHRLHKR
jgi:transposase